MAYHELPAFDALEAGSDLDRLWLRGGFPESFIASSDDLSIRWRTHFIRTYLERDLPQTGLRTPVETLRRFWTMLSHLQGSVFNAAVLARSLGVSVPSVNRYTDTMVDMMLLRRLQPYHVNVGKRLIKSPRMLVRDSGVVHALLNIRSLDDLLGHPVAGASWEGLVVENLIGAAPAGTIPFFYRTRSGAEIDLLLLLPGQEIWAVEVKRSSAPRVPRGFRIATTDVAAVEKFVVHAGTDYLSARGRDHGHPVARAHGAIDRQVVAPAQDLQRHVARRAGANHPLDPCSGQQPGQRRSGGQASGSARRLTIRRTRRSLLAGALSAMRRVSAVSAWGFRS